MLFQNLSFILFCLLTFAVYWRLPAARLWVLAVANAIFYMAAGWQNLLLFLGASFVTFWLGQHVTGKHGKALLILGIVANVANLALFKYAGFLGENLHPWIPFLDPALVKDVLLPIGISFYTFQHISYLVDRRIKDLAPAPNYLHFWVYISFFGHSIAGPIMRGHEFFPQIAETVSKRLDVRELQYGLALFTLGLFKKVAIADAIAPHVQVAFKNPGALTMAEAWVAAALFAFQIYYDFSAYSDMAVGIGHMFGYKLTLNFRTPYLAANASEFWDRWHITLSKWIRDYVYIPLGGNRVPAFRQRLNLFLAMLVSGLWHGAAWTFIFWGAFHGLLLLGQRLWATAKARLGWRFFDTTAYRVLAVAGFFALTVVGWVFFRAAGLSEAFLMLRAMVDPSQLPSFLTVKTTLLLILGLYGLHMLEAWARAREDRLGAWWERIPAPVQGVVYTSVVITMVFAYRGSQEFIYFQF